MRKIYPRWKRLENVYIEWISKSMGTDENVVGIREVFNFILPCTVDSAPYMLLSCVCRIYYSYHTD